MGDIIQLLPDSVANQIAAGEVIQRPASVIKELVENSIDAQSTQIDVIVKDAGKTLLQIIDNGLGMSETDARLSFERHATSKIRSANDLFSIRSMGFRGEALASIAAIAHVNLKTRQEADELGTEIVINGSVVEKQEIVSCPKGTNFSIKNLFFNVPARRKFLKSDGTEFKHIASEFQRVALANPEITFSLRHNGELLYKLNSGNMKQRIVAIFGKSLNNSLTPISVETSLATITGFVGKPTAARKTPGDQFFFVNQRFMRSAYFQKAITIAYDKLLTPGMWPLYFIYFEINPERIDINIHPTKTEIKFEDGVAIFQVLRAAVREALGKFNIMPSIDFNQDGAIDIPVLTNDTQVNTPTIDVDPTYNPFDSDQKKTVSRQSYSGYKKESVEDWDQLYNSFEKGETSQASFVENEEDTKLFEEKIEIDVETSVYLQVKNRYILTPVKSGVMMIDILRAHQRILFEDFLKLLENSNRVSQQSLFPSSVSFESGDFAIILEMIPVLVSLGFDINEFGKNTIVINGVPAMLVDYEPIELIQKLLEFYKDSPLSIDEEINQLVAKNLAKATALNRQKKLTTLEMQGLIENLFACSVPNHTPDGKTVITILETSEILQKFS